jgi:hypothetical protein
MSSATIEATEIKPEFRAWPKIGRLNRNVVVTEKIDGTNAAVIISYDLVPEYIKERVAHEGVFDHIRYEGGTIVINPADGQLVWVGCQSRKRLITPEQDNFNFAQWVFDNAVSLAMDLGDGYHFGEWWGSGIQRGYGLEKGVKKFSLFNVKKWSSVMNPDAPDFFTENLHTVPVLDIHTFSTERINSVVGMLRASGSKASPGFFPPEGVVVFHTATNDLYKVMCENDETPKGA